MMTYESVVDLIARIRTAPTPADSFAAVREAAPQASIPSGLMLAGALVEAARTTEQLTEVQAFTSTLGFSDHAYSGLRQLIKERHQDIARNRPAQTSLFETRR